MNVTFESFNLKSPFSRFAGTNIPPNLEVGNWQYPESKESFELFIKTLNPSIIIELGTWLGWSAITMAKICKENSIDCKILCVDTWLGSIEHWREDKCNALKEFEYFSNGTSVMFDAFCKNVISNGVEEYIIPLPNTTSTMFSLFRHLNITATMVYVDASHERRDVLFDMSSYFTLLEAGGYIFGDDARWPEVKSAATEFSEQVGRPIQFTSNGNIFYIVK